MEALVQQIQQLCSPSTQEISVFCLGNFSVCIKEHSEEIQNWGRDKTLQLFQFLITHRHHRGLHKEKIIDRLWDDLDMEAGERDFKVALHGIHKILEPERKRNADPHFVRRQGPVYRLHREAIWLDVDVFEQLISEGNRLFSQEDTEAAILYFQKAIELYRGDFLPDRLYEDWSSSERERLQLLALGAIIQLAELLLDKNPLESIHLTQKALLIDPVWEDAYRIQMKAYLRKGNRPLAIRTFQQCTKVLEDEFGIEPLPETKKLFQEIKGF
ncbi:MAG: bacterial transcriptional activator domain-containing protein [Microscillaceae bacterium]|nr:bacterial transcriptional activator domain-containing protein [Microscillaceae bacterium]